MQNLNRIPLIFICAFIALTSSIEAQSFKKEYRNWKKGYKRNFRIDETSPLGRIGVLRLRFFKARANYRTTADLLMSTTEDVIAFPTTTGKTMEYTAFAKAVFKIYEQSCTLTVYKSAKALTNENYQNFLFVPFRDYTSGDESYGGGRYIDLLASDVKDGKLVIDFNRAYNPYCAYNELYSCPVPPAENSLPLEIRAGEKKYRKRGRASRNQ
ncbi:MAG: DUF1684 domain-containing protein [Bacteroidia bacterium]|jgi:uncharacterized protein (DUF1684 family)